MKYNCLRHDGRIRSAVPAAVVCVTVLLLALASNPALARSGSLSHTDRSETSASDSLDLNYSVDEQPYFDAIDFLPAIIRDQILLKRYIRDPRFLEVRRLCTDTSAVDAIFLKAMEIADDDIGRALFVSLLGTMDHFRVGIKIPVLGVLWIPLTTETDAVFRMRHEHLPQRILPDSAGRTASDKDKMQHFFGSAWIAYLTNSPSLAGLFGNLIESGEDAFVVGGVNDERDKFANSLGREFGRRLFDEEGILPSDVLWK